MRLIPRELRRKQALLWLAAIVAGFGGAGVVGAGCGGSSAPQPPREWQTVRGSGFSFEAPAGWKVGRATNRVSATRGAELVQVATFSLLKPYDEKLFGRVARELRARMEEIATQTSGRLSGERTVTAGGVRSHAYDVTAGKRADEYTFVFSGKREYLLLCRRQSPDGAGFCPRLVTSFARR